MNPVRGRGIAALDRIIIAKSTELGLRLRNARRRRGWGVRECAERACISETTLKGVEAGDPSVGWGYYLALFQLFGMSSEIDGLCSPHRDLMAPGCEPGDETVTFDKDL